MNKNSMTNRRYDLVERIEKFSMEIINFAKLLPQTPVNFALISQIVRSGTSVGANYIEADEALSKKDFIYRIRICLKETKETQYWLRIISKSEINAAIEKLLTETEELILIFASSIKTAKLSSTIS
jgi:four helix bundle protein